MEELGDKFRKMTGLKFISYFYDKDMKSTGTGTHIWDGIIVFIKYLNEHKEDFKGKNVLELAAGTGAGGLALTQYGINKLTLTDIDKVCLDNMKENIELNKDKLNPDNIDIQLLNYGKKESFDEFFNKCKVDKYDYFIAIDAMFIDFHVDYFFTGMDILFEKYPNAILILINIRFYIMEKFDDNLEEKKNRYTFDIINGQTLEPSIGDVVIYIIKLKK